MLFEMLAGRSPFEAQGGGKVLGMHMFVAPPLLRQLAPDTPASLADLVQRLLSKKKDARPTMRQLATTLERLGEQYPLAKRPGHSKAPGTDDDAVPDATIRMGGGPSTLGMSASQTLRKNQRRRRIGMAVGGAAIPLGIVTTLLLSRGHPAQEQPLPPTPGAAQPRPMTPRVDSAPPSAEPIHVSDVVPRTPEPPPPPGRAIEKVTPKPAVSSGAQKVHSVHRSKLNAADELVKPPRPTNTQPIRPTNTQPIYDKPPLEK
jgi:hypothetical protein